MWAFYAQAGYGHERTNRIINGDLKMNSDEKSPIAEQVRPDLKVDNLLAMLKDLSESGMNQMNFILPDGDVINSIEIITQSAVPTHLLFSRIGPDAQPKKLLGKCPACGYGEAYVRVISESKERRFGAICNECNVVACQCSTLEETIKQWDVHGIIE